MRFFRTLSCALAFISLSAFGAQTAGNASGSLTVNGKKIPLNHAYAYHDDAANETRVFIADRALDAATLADRGLLAKVNGVEIFVNKDNVVETVEVFNKAFGMPTPSTGHNFWWEPYRLSGNLVGGRSRTKQPETFFKNTWDYDVTFLTTVGAKAFEIPAAATLDAAHKANDAREAKRVLPASGGDEGTAYLAYRKSLEARNGKGLFDAMTPAMKSAIAADMHAASLTESALESWAFMQSMPPGKVDVVGGVRNDDATTLELRKTDPSGHKWFGTAKLVKQQGVWKIASETWR